MRDQARPELTRICEDRLYHTYNAFVHVKSAAERAADRIPPHDSSEPIDLLHSPKRTLALGKGGEYVETGSDLIRSLADLREYMSGDQSDRPMVEAAYSFHAQFQERGPEERGPEDVEREVRDGLAIMSSLERHQLVLAYLAKPRYEAFGPFGNLAPYTEALRIALAERNSEHLVPMDAAQYLHELDAAYRSRAALSPQQRDVRYAIEKDCNRGAAELARTFMSGVYRAQAKLHRN